VSQPVNRETPPWVYDGRCDAIHDAIVEFHTLPLQERYDALVQDLGSKDYAAFVRAWAEALIDERHADSQRDADEARGNG
jgi:hypothetical protein